MRHASNTRKSLGDSKQGCQFDFLFFQWSLGSDNAPYGEKERAHDANRVFHTRIWVTRPSVFACANHVNVAAEMCLRDVRCFTMWPWYKKAHIHHWRLWTRFKGSLQRLLSFTLKTREKRVRPVMQQPAQKWLAVTSKWDPCEEGETFEVSKEIRMQISLDIERTYESMLFGYAASPAMTATRRSKVSELLINWLQKQTYLTYMQGMNLIMATCLREVEEEDATLHLFDFMIRRTNENLFHKDAEMLVAATKELATNLHGMVEKDSPRLAHKLANAEIDFMPMMVQNWLIDTFLHVLPIDASQRLWDHILETPGIPLKFAAQLILCQKEALLACDEEELHEILVGLPEKAQTAEDVDWLLAESFEDENPPVEVNVEVNAPLALPEVPDFKQELIQAAMPVEVVAVKPVIRMPRRWQPWKLITVALVVPWLLMSATQAHRPMPSRGSPSPVLRRASLPAIVHVVPMHEANWPTTKANWKSFMFLEFIRVSASPRAFTDLPAATVAHPRPSFLGRVRSEGLAIPDSLIHSCSQVKKCDRAGCCCWFCVLSEEIFAQICPDLLDCRIPSAVLRAQSAKAVGHGVFEVDACIWNSVAPIQTLEKSYSRVA